MKSLHKLLMGTFFIATFVLGQKNVSGNKYENQMFNNINDEIEETDYDNRNPNSNNNRDYTDTLLYDLNWIESDLMNPGDVMVTAFQMEAFGILKGVNVPVYDWGDTEGELTVSIHNLSYPYGSDGIMYDQSLVNSSGWLAGYDDDGTGAISLEGEIWNSDAGTCGGGTMIGNATDPLGSEHAEDGGPAGVPSMGLVWPDGFTAYTLNPTNNPGIVGGGGDNWRSLEPYGSEPEVSLGDWIGVVVQNTGTGSVQFQYSDGGNESDPWKSITFYGTDCQGIGGETGWYIQSYIFNYQLAIELSSLEPELATIEDQEITEDNLLTIVVSATSVTNASMTFSASSDTSDVSVTIDSTTLIATPAPDWNGISNITVIVTDENELSDTTDFTLTVSPVNDSPEDFNVIYPTVSDTFSTHVESDTAIVFNWEESFDVDSDVMYTLTIELEFFGNTYTDVHDNISDTTISISSNSLDPLLDVTSQDEAIFTYTVQASDEESTVASDVGEFVLSRAALGSVDGYAIPEQFSLHQNYPNPFNPVTTLQYDLPEDGFVNITIYDMMGRVVSNLVSSQQNAGYKSVQWNATNNAGKPVSAGLYLYTIEAGEFRQVRKMVLLK